MQEIASDRVSIGADEYVALRREYILKVDRHRPILYPLDYINTKIYCLSPLEGFLLAMLQGDRPFQALEELFRHFFPEAAAGTLREKILALDERVRQEPTPTGIGTNGLVEVSRRPIESAVRFDLREFVIAPKDFQAVMADVKTRCRLETPIIVYTVFTHRCFTDCAYCYAERRHVHEMPLSRWKEILREMADLHIYMASPDNGDTFARKDGIDFLECLLEHDMHFLLSTKAHVSKEHVKRLVDAGFAQKVRGVISRRVQLSVDAVDSEVARRILNVPHPRVEKMRETLENFLNVGIMPKVKAVITGLNYDQPKPIVDFFYPHGAREFHFVRYHRSFHRHTDDLFVKADQVAVLKRQFCEIREKYPDVLLVENLSQAREAEEELSPERARERWANRIGCGGGWYALGISADGAAFLCEQMKIDEETIVGDANRQSVMEIWNGERLRQFIHPTRDQFADAACGSCGEFEECMWEMGRCYRDAYYSYGSIYQPPPMCPQQSRPGVQLS